MGGAGATKRQSSKALAINGNMNKTSVWAAMIMHDQLKFKEEEELRRERDTQQKAELRRFY